MKRFSLIWTFLIAIAVFESVACSRSNSPEVRTKMLSASESRRQIELQKAIGLSEIEGKSVSDFPAVTTLDLKSDLIMQSTLINQLAGKKMCGRNPRIDQRREKLP